MFMMTRSVEPKMDFQIISHEDANPRSWNGVSDESRSSVVALQPPSNHPFIKTPQVFAQDEWTPLREVIVGRAEYSQFPSEPLKAMTACVPRFYLDEFRPKNPFPHDIVKKAGHELDAFAQALEAHGVKVRRPELVDWGKVGGYTGAMPRDGIMVVGDTVLVSCFSWRCRRHEIQLAYKPILEDLERRGYRVVWPLQAPDPDNIFDVEPGDFFCINNTRVAFDVADFIRIGKYVVGQLSNTTNEKGVHYVRSHLPAGYELIIIKTTNEKEFHIDATFMPIGPKTALFNPESVSEQELRRHPPLHTWRLLPSPYKPQWHKYPPPYMCSPLLNLNVLCLDEKRVFCEKDDIQMQQYFRDLGMEPIILPFKHVWCLGGSFHCATSDLLRSHDKH